MAKLKVGLIYGGESFEHEVSKMTAESIRENIDRDKFNVVDIYIDENGQFDEDLLNDIDVAFLAVHGPNCEDGKLQQFLEGRGLKYTGSGVEASRINLNKTLMHDVFKKSGLPTVEYRGFNIKEREEIQNYIQMIGLPVIIKPNNMGSSVGMTKITDIDQLEQAIFEASKCDGSLIVEKAVVNPRELEVAVLSNGSLIVSEPGEILTHGQIYSYKNKYQAPFATTATPDLGKKERAQLKSLAKQAFVATGCNGYARVDFFLGDHEIYINEVNTLPGFTAISMFPKMMANIGIDYEDLITKIIDLALE